MRRFYIVHDITHHKIGFAVANRLPNIDTDFVSGDSTNPPLGTSRPVGEVFDAGSNVTVNTFTDGTNTTNIQLRSDGYKFGISRLLTLALLCLQFRI